MRNNYAALEAGWVLGHSEAFKKNAVGKIQLYDSGGGGGGPQESTTYTTNLPEYAEPYYGRMVSVAKPFLKRVISRTTHNELLALLLANNKHSKKL
jgi:hypothetical protein